MKIPILDLAADTGDEHIALPAVAAVAAGGFVATALPVARIGKRDFWRLMVLVDYETRARLARDLCESEIRLRDVIIADRPQCLVTGIPGDASSTYQLPATYITTGYRQGPWHNACNQWVAVPWLIEVCVQVQSPSIGTAGLLACAKAAAALSRPYGGRSYVEGAK